MTDYAKFVESIQDEVTAFLKGREEGMAKEEQR
jgi:urea carboxylase